METISQEEFDRYAAKWLHVLTKRSSGDLQQCFLGANEVRMPYVSFPIEHIGWLISTVGSHHIEARFLVMSDGNDQKDRFVLALYAVDARGIRISAYYLAKPPKPAQLGADNAADMNTVAEQVPHYMVKKWLEYWNEAGELTPEMFVNSYGLLQGYTFSVDDFMKPLFNSQPFGAQELRVGLGLHKYFSALHYSKPTYTFGLVLRLYKPATPGEAGAVETSSEPFYDMSTPCPPGF
ncbi:hypothetical protein D0T11_02375 [Hymenobacter rubripertinctus]|uniref:Uncharacterized protein n=1 Tax=Hymenobacter rubripertinctus TaxID=2029981 RepID=A0A418R7N3_9BACT|nr:hypothetical protein D0T11_02375 [Hymenobacter rubripertinctus]